MLPAWPSCSPRIAPVYFHNLQLQNYVSRIDTVGVKSRPNPTTYSARLVLDKAHQLELPVMADNVQIKRSTDGSLQHIDVRYFVRVDFPGYTVDLHFYPGAGSR